MNNPIKKTLNNKDFKFFYKNGELLVEVKIPCYTTIYMGLGKDNRPFETIINDIRLAYEMLDESIEGSYVKSVTIALELPKLLGYRRSNASLC